MCADDVVCTGAEPLFFLDYLAVGAVVPERVAAIVEGVAEGCRRAGCALLGGETAEHPGVMPDDQFDLAGFCVGVVDEAELLGPDRVREGDVLVGLASSGLHANGYSLVRQRPARATARSTRRRRSSAAARSPTSCSSRARSTRRRCSPGATTGCCTPPRTSRGAGSTRTCPGRSPPGSALDDRSGLLAGAADLRARAASRGCLRRRHVRDVQHGPRHGARGRSGDARRVAGGRRGPPRSRSAGSWRAPGSHRLSCPRGHARLLVNGD